VTIIHPQGNRATEHELVMALISFLIAWPSHSADWTTIFFHLPSFIVLSPQDRAMSRSRPNEQKWQGIVRNISSHANCKAMRDGYLNKRRGGGFWLNLRGRKPVAKKRLAESTITLLASGG
jgi:hypothetical protein